MSSPDMPRDGRLKANSKTNGEPDTAAGTSPPRKRKRDKDQETEELEIDVSLPEPPSKKALRKAKKQKDPKHTEGTATVASETSAHGPNSSSPAIEGQAALSSKPASSAYGIWIGNLPWNATKPMLRSFFTSGAEVADSDAPSLITEESITRVHMPAPTNAVKPNKSQLKPLNKGFAYVDFSSAAALEAALALSEATLGGRRVLIKSAKDFAGRPEKPAASATGDAAAGTSGGTANGASKADGKGKTPTRRVFVGNLGFDVTKEDLETHFGVCGAVEQVFIATFEDTGKCKGFGWVVFEGMDAAASAVRGWAYVDAKHGAVEHGPEAKAEEHGDVSNGNEEGADEKDAKKKKSKPKKWFVNRLQGRSLRCEFAEDPTTRYKKRFGKERESNTASRKPLQADTNRNEPISESNDDADAVAGPPEDRRGLGIMPGAPTDARKRRGHTEKSKKIQEESMYRTGAITEATGTKVTFN